MDEVAAMRCVAWFAVLLLACEGGPGSYSAAHGEVEYTAASGGFSVRFLAPPWQLVREEPEELELAIPPEVFGVALEGSPPTHVFRMDHADAPEGLDGLLDKDAPMSAELPGYLRSVDLRSPPEVALAELNHLIDEEAAQLDQELDVVVTDAGTPGLVYQVIVEPGLFVRGFYFAAQPTVVRAVFVSLFDLGTADVDLMVDSIETVQ